MRDKNCFTMERVSLHVSEFCNLKCKLCGTWSPYIEAKAIPLEMQERFLEKYFKVVDYVEKFSLTGGEPLTSVDLPKLLKIIGVYENQIGEIEIITNGTILPSEALLEVCKSHCNKIKFLVDDYGKEISKQAEAIDKVLTSHDIRHVVRSNSPELAHCNGWVDYGDLTTKRRDQVGIQKIYSKCAQPQKLNLCFNVLRGVAYPCIVALRCTQLGSTSDNANEYVDFFDDSLSLEEQRNKIENIYAAKGLSACAYCDGMCDDSERFVPAEQLTEQELSCIKKGANTWHDVCKMISESVD